MIEKFFKIIFNLKLFFIFWSIKMIHLRIFCIKLFYLFLKVKLFRLFRYQNFNKLIIVFAFNKKCYDQCAPIGHTALNWSCSYQRYQQHQQCADLVSINHSTRSHLTIYYIINNKLRNLFVFTPKNSVVPKYFLIFFNTSSMWLHLLIYW